MDRSLNVSFINSLCVENDAISMAIRDEMAALAGNPRICTKLFAYRCDIVDVAFIPVGSVGEIVFNRHFQTSDVVIAHFGVRYPLFNVLPLSPRKAAKLVVFHNVTPKAHSPRSTHDAVDVSLRQISNAQWADHVICDSATNLEALRGAGVNTPASILPLATHISTIPPMEKPSFKDGIVRFVFIGRFVRSKGVTDLLQAIATVLESGDVVNLRLDLIGNTEFSSPQILERILSKIDELRHGYGARLSIDLIANASENTKEEILRRADIFVLPTYHEGFCVPILEAIAAGCQVITYDNTNTASVSGGLATLVATGDIEQLSEAIHDATLRSRSAPWQGRGPESYGSYANRGREHINSYRPEVVQARFREFVVPFALAHVRRSSASLSSSRKASENR